MRVLWVVALAVLLAPSALATTVGSGVGIKVTTESFGPLIWGCGHRILIEDYVQPGRASEGGQELVERINNYAFEGEQIQWDVLVMDKNGIEKIRDVYMTIGRVQDENSSIEANCMLLRNESELPDFASCNARILEEELQFEPQTMAFYRCTLTVEPPCNNMYGLYWVTTVVEDLDGNSRVLDEHEYWFFNPVIGLNIDGGVGFYEVRPGTLAYSPTMRVGNAADPNSGVLLDMFISGTDFYDPTSFGAKCPDSNVLGLSNFAYYATNGAYSTRDDPRSDAEGYVPITYGNYWDSSRFYGKAEIIQAAKNGYYYAANVLAPGAWLPITFRLSVPEPCTGTFLDGQIYFWGEAI